MCGRTARVVRTAAINVSCSERHQSSSVTERKPSVRGVTAPALLTKMSTGTASSAAATSSSGPPANVRSTVTAVTAPALTSSLRSAVVSREPVTTATPSATRRLVVARPMPLLAPVTIARRPVSPRSISQPVRVQPLQYGVRDFLPAVVDGQGVPATFELLELGDSSGVSVLLERRPGDDVRDGV